MKNQTVHVCISNTFITCVHTQTFCHPFSSIPFASILWSTFGKEFIRIQSQLANREFLIVLQMFSRGQNHRQGQIQLPSGQGQHPEKRGAHLEGPQPSWGGETPQRVRGQTGGLRRHGEDERRRPPRLRHDQAVTQRKTE